MLNSIGPSGRYHSENVAILLHILAAGLWLRCRTSRPRVRPGCLRCVGDFGWSRSALKGPRWRDLVGSKMADAKWCPAEPPPRKNCFGSPLELSMVHWAHPEVVVDVIFLTRTEDGLLR